MKTRCYNKNFLRYVDYGRRGISICDEWKNNFKAFYDWAISNGYSNELTIDRIDNDGNYEPNNCRWATVSEQNRNSRHNNCLTYNGETHCLKEWSEITGLNYGCLKNRMKYGWNVEDILTKPKGYNQGICKTNNVHNCIPVICIETNKKYNSSKDAERDTGIAASTIRKCCKGIVKHAGKFHWKYI